jgi:lipopolysaccharide/colanic/teichoic acid biosynthesis glycosyltransferase
MEQMVVEADLTFIKTKTSLSIQATDVLVSAIILLCCLPVMLIIAVLIKICDRGPVFFRQVRPGLGLRDITIIKFRTMRVGADKFENEKIKRVKEPNVQTEYDDRVTRIGNILRRLSVDELPQLLLVVRGKMSLVGPRPLIKAEVKQLPRKYLGRFQVLPGLTGLAQVSGRAKLSVWDILEQDLRWVENYSFGLYLRILWKTLFAVFKTKEAF